MKRAVQISESIELGAILALAGGFMDAYSYIERGKVFANAQTGNILLFGVHISEGNFSLAFHYFVPVFAFAIGIALAELIHKRENKHLHWRQISIFIESIILLSVSFISLDLNLLANSLTSLACGMQVETFRKIHGKGIATTMCIGNLRSATQNLCDYIDTKEKHHLESSFLYFGVIACFTLGAICGNFFITTMKQHAIIICSILHFIAFFIMFIDREKIISES